MSVRKLALAMVLIAAPAMAQEPVKQSMPQVLLIPTATLDKIANLLRLEGGTVASLIMVEIRDCVRLQLGGDTRPSDEVACPAVAAAVKKPEQPKVTP